MRVSMFGAQAKNVAEIAFLIIVLFCTIVPVGLGAELPRIDVTVDSSKVVGVNSLSLGFFVDYPWEWKAFRDRPAQRQLVRDANFKIVYICDRHLGPLDYSRGVGPCTRWDENTQTGTFDWADVDSVVQAIFDVGAEPYICLSRWEPKSQKPTVPPGMAVNPDTLLPYPESYAAFVAAWVQHFKDVGLPVRYYGIFCEIQTYIGWNWNSRNEVRTTFFVDLFNAAYASMHQVNPQVSVSFDASTLKWVFPRLLSHGVGIDFLDFHKYDDWKHPPYAFSDQKMFQRAEDVYFQVEDSDTYTVDYVRDTWFGQRGVMLPVILSEGNWNAAYGPTDERIQQMAGAVRTALVLRMGILKGLSYNAYYTLSSDVAWETETYGSGRGYGMINSKSRYPSNPSINEPWYPYYVHQMIGSSLSVGDKLVESASSSDDIRSLAWIHGGKLNLLLICKSNTTETVNLHGLEGSLDFSRIDNDIPWQTPSIQTGTVNSADPITVKGYTVMLLQARFSEQYILEDGFESGDLSGWTGTNTSSGETATVRNWTPHQGTYSGRFTSNGGGGVEYAYCYKSVDEEELFVRGYFYIRSGLPLVDENDRFYFLRFQAGGQSLVGAGVRRRNGVDSWIVYARDGSGWVGPVYATSPAIEMGRWYCVELHWRKHASQGLVELYVDDVKILELAGVDTSDFGNVDTVNFGIITARNLQNNLEVYGDCVVFSNTYIGPESSGTRLGDIDHDGVVDIRDITIVARSLGSAPGDADWNPSADLNNDGFVNMLDLVIVAMNFGS